MYDFGPMEIKYVEQRVIVEHVDRRMATAGNRNIFTRRTVSMMRTGNIPLSRNRIGDSTMEPSSAQTETRKGGG